MAIQFLNKSSVYFHKHNSTSYYTGGKKYLRWWKNRWIGYVQIKDGCTTEVSIYLKELRSKAKYHWELDSDEWLDRVTVRFYNEKDLLYFKMIWG